MTDVLPAVNMSSNRKGRILGMLDGSVMCMPSSLFMTEKMSATCLTVVQTQLFLVSGSEVLVAHE